MVDQRKIETAVHMILEAIGEDPSREGLRETPQRVARMYEEVCKGYESSAAEHLGTVFSEEGSHIVVERDIVFYSLCEHHLLPFFGKVHIAYVPDEKVTGLSKLARTVEVFARRLQLQERLTAQIADALMDDLGAKGALVLAEASHMCMTMRGIKSPEARTVTIAKRGIFETNELLTREAMTLIGVNSSL